MRKIIFILILILTTLSCQRNNSKSSKVPVEYYYVQYNLESNTELYLDTTRIEYHQVLNDSIYSLTYIPKLIDKNDTVKIIVKESKYFQPEYFYNRKKVDFEFVSNRKYLIEGELFWVYKYVKNPSVIDGCVTQFWNPDFGIVIKRSSTWKDFSKLQTNSENINRIINLLFDVINQDTEFYYGCKEELELIPKSDVREFYDWKFKDELINLNE